MEKDINKDIKNVCRTVENNKRVVYFDILNILACICVVFLHMNGIVHNYSTTRAWKTALIFETVCYWAVPVFIMLSGATLLKYRNRYNTKTFFKKRFTKIFIPWIVWSFVIYVINNKNFNIMQFIKDFVYCRIEGIYWFFPLILYLYCLIPIFSILIEKEENRKILWGIVIFLFITCSVLNPLCTVFDINFPSVLSYYIGQNDYVIFLLLGYLLSTMELKKTNRIIIYLLGIIRYTYTYTFSIKEGIVNRDLFNYCSAVSVLLAVAVFVFIKNINWENILSRTHINSKIAAKISGCSFGVYLIHIILKNNITNILNLNSYSIWYRTVGAIVLYFVCVAIVYLLKKIPILKNIVP